MADVYKIGIEIALANTINTALQTVASRLLGIHTRVGDIERSFARWTLAIAGVGAVLVGGEIIKGLKSIIEHGAEVNHQLELMKISGMEAGETFAMQQLAIQATSNVMTSSYAGNLKHIRELRYAFGETAPVAQYLDALNKSAAVLSAVKGVETDQIYEFTKGLELKGLTPKPEEFKNYIDTMTQAVIASGGRVTPAAFFSAFKYGRTAMFGWDETFVGQYLPRLIQSMSTGSGGGGGGTGGPGNALMSAFAKVVQGQMPKKAAQEWERFGLGKETPIEGSSESLMSGMQGAGLFLKNPYEWVQKILIPALAAKGVTSQGDITQTISKMFPVRTASQIITEMALQGRGLLGDQSPFEKDARLSREAMGPAAAYDELIKNDYPTLMAAFNKQWESLLQALGSPLLQPGGLVLTGMAAMTNALNSMFQFAANHPDGVNLAAKLAGGAAIGLIFGGIVAILGAIAPFVAAPAAIGLAAAGLVALQKVDWNAIDSGARKAAAGLTALAATIWDKFKEIIGKPGDTTPANPGINPWDDPSGGATQSPEALKKQSYVPQLGGGGGTQGTMVVNLGGREVAEALMPFLIDGLSKALEGSAYPNYFGTQPASDTRYTS